MLNNLSALNTLQQIQNQQNLISQQQLLSSNLNTFNPNFMQPQQLLTQQLQQNLLLNPEPALKVEELAQKQTIALSNGLTMNPIKRSNTPLNTVDPRINIKID
jgi:hypothetical protein